MVDWIGFAGGWTRGEKKKHRGGKKSCYVRYEQGRFYIISLLCMYEKNALIHGEAGIKKKKKEDSPPPFFPSYFNYVITTGDTFFFFLTCGSFIDESFWNVFFFFSPVVLLVVITQRPSDDFFPGHYTTYACHANPVTVFRSWGLRSITLTIFYFFSSEFYICVH